MALSTQLRVSFSAKRTGTLDLGGTEDNITRSLAISLASGTAAGQADRIHQKTYTINASSTTDIDLAGGVIDPDGQTFSFVKVKGLYVEAAAANTNNVVVGGAASAQWVGPFGAATHTIAVRPGGVELNAVGDADLNAWAVTATTADTLRLANSGAGTSVTCYVLIWGTSA